MSSMYHKVFVGWCLLMSIGLDVVCPAENDPDTFVNYKNMGKWLKHAKSVWIHGSEIELEKWLPAMVETGARDDLDAVKTYTFVQCECAFFIGNSVDIINASVKQCSNDADCAVNKRVILDLELLNETLQLTVTVLFELRDAFPALKSGESQLLTTLLTASLYLDALKSAVENKADEKDGKQQQLQTALVNMKRVLLQISTAVDEYAMENCFISLHTRRDTYNRRDLQQQLDELCDFLMNIVSLDTGRPYSVIHEGSLLLEKCVRHDVVSYENPGLTRLCDEYLIAASYVKPQEKDLENKTLPELLAFVHDTPFDLEPVFEYLNAVYKVILKLIYQATARHLQLQQQDKDRSSLDVASIVGRLRSMNCPIEMIDNFELVTRVESYGNENLVTDTVEEIVVPNANGIDDVELTCAESKLEELSLADLMRSVLAVELTHFWRGFNLLREERAKRSPRAYDMSLNLIPENRISTLTERDGKNCKASIDAYLLCFNIKTAIINGYAGAYGVDKKFLAKNLSEIIPHFNGVLSNYLQGKLSKWVGAGNLSTDDDLYKIFSATIFGLNTNFNDADVNVTESTVEDIKKLITRKLEKLTRTINGFTNRLDNYHVRNCLDLKNVNSIYENEFYEVLKSRKTTSEMITNKYGLIVTPSGADDISSGKTNPTDLYDFAKSTERDSVMRSESLGSGILFRWRGESKNMREILTDISDNMLNIQDLVDYQRLYSQWMIYAYYHAWFDVFDRMLRVQKVNEALEFLRSLNEIILPGRFQQFVEYFASKYAFYYLAYELGVYGEASGIADGVKKDILSPMSELLGIVSDGSVRTVDVLNFLKIGQDELPSPAEVMQRTLHAIETKFIFSEPLLPTFTDPRN